MTKIKDLKYEFGRIGVLMGGDSSEREISLKSGNAVFESFKRSGADVAAIDIKDTKNITGLKKYILSRKIDTAFIAMHGFFGEDGQLQAILQELNIAYTGSGPRASALAMDKIASREIFKANGIRVPEFLVVENNNFNYSGLNFPLVIKPFNNGSSIGLSIADTPGKAKDAFLTAKNYSHKVIIEEYQRGDEITVGILAEKPLPVIMLKFKEQFYNYKAKYTQGMTEYILPAPLEENITRLCQEVALKAHGLLDLWCFSRVDMILKNGAEPVVLEINSIPGLTPLSLLPKAAGEYGLNFDELCIKLIGSSKGGKNGKKEK